MSKEQTVVSETGWFVKTAIMGKVQSFNSRNSLSALTKLYLIPVITTDCFLFVQNNCVQMAVKPKFSSAKIKKKTLVSHI
jgi:hypothetical protein